MKRPVKVHFEFSCLSCGMQMNLNIASLRGVIAPVCCPCCAVLTGPEGFLLVDERVICSMRVVAAGRNRPIPNH